MIGLNQIRLEETCEGCPEQYDAFYQNYLVGYLRLRHGYFTVKFPNSDGELIYDAYPQGDGSFDSDEREHFLTEAKQAIINKLNNKEDENN